MSAAPVLDVAASRSDYYQLMAQVLEYPDDTLLTFVASGEFETELSTLLGAILPGSRTEPGTVRPPRSWTSEALPADYLALFEVGSGGAPPCPLSGGAWGGVDRRLVMEECVRFYEHFGLRLDPHRRELPDALGTQLEFLHYLAYQQAQRDPGDAQRASFERAERDFLVRHPGRWLPLLRPQLDNQSEDSFYRYVLTILAHSLTELAR